jgi:NitT/TauT family transport system substrate-binding protein
LAGKGNWSRGRAAVAAVAMAAVAALAGCSHGSGAVSAGSLPSSYGPAEKTTLNVGVVPAMDSAGFFVALKQGLFAREGLHVNYAPAISSETAVQEQLQGKLDISGGNYVSYLQQAVAGKPIELISEASIMQPGSQVIYTMPGSRIKTLADLKGKLIGVNAPDNIDYLLTASVLAENGVDPRNVKFPTASNPAFAKTGGAIPFPTMAGVLASGGIAAATMPEPFASLAEQNVGAIPLADLNQGATTDFPVEGYVVTKHWAQTYPNTLRRFLAALSLGQEIADTNRTAVEAAFESLKSAPDGQVPPGIASVMALNTYPIGIDQTRIQRVANVMYQFGLLTRKYNVATFLLPSSFFDFSQFSSATH